MNDIFTTDWSMLGVVVEEATLEPRKNHSSAKRTAKTFEIGGISFTRSPSAEARAKLSAINKGKTHSVETRAKLSAITKARSAEIQARIAAANKGKTRSAETRARMSAAGGWAKGISYTGERLAKHQKQVMEALRKPVMTPKGLFNSMKEAAEAYGWYHDNPVRYRINKFPSQWYYISKDTK